MSLGRALTRLNTDRAMDGVVRDVLLLFRRHPLESLAPARVAEMTDRPLSLVGPILTTLSECFVLDFQSDPVSYRYAPDALLEIDVERYLERVGTAQGRLQNNVARFRRRQGEF